MNVIEYKNFMIHHEGKGRDHKIQLISEFSTIEGVIADSDTAKQLLKSSGLLTVRGKKFDIDFAAAGHEYRDVGDEQELICVVFRPTPTSWKRYPQCRNVELVIYND